VTRYLCAASHLDPQFARAVRDELLGLRRRALVPSPGVDLATVARHSLSACQRRTGRNLLLAITMAAALVLALATGPLTGEAGLILLGGLAASWAIIFGERWIGRYGILATHLRQENFDPETVWPRLSRDLADAWLRLKAEQAGNIIVYEGSPPFLGAGRQLGEDPAWQLVVDVERPKKTLVDDLGSKPQRIELDELHDHMRKALHQLNMEGLVVEDHLYVDVGDAPPDQTFWDYREQRPLTWIDDDVMRSSMRTPSETVRHFRAVRVIAWSGQLVVTIFLHAVRVGPLLYMRARYHCLTPLKQAFRRVDSIPPVPSFAEVLAQAGAAAGELVGGVVHPSRWFKPTAVVRHLRHRTVERRHDTAMKRMRGRLGWYPRIRWYRTSIRSRASDQSLRRYFHLVDQAKSIQIVERCLLNSLVSFLDERGVDTSDLVRQQMTILNSGVIVSGNGQLNTKNLAVGDDSTAGDTLLDDD
jgi:hypothetical protein